MGKMIVRHIIRNVGRMAVYSVLSVSVIAVFSLVLFVHSLEYFVSDNQRAQTNVPESLTTDTWGIFDPLTGEITQGNNVSEKRSIASITKLFTAEATMKSTQKDVPFIIEHFDVSEEGRSGKLALGTYMSAYELLFPLLIESSNDAGESIRRHLEDEFTLSAETTIESLGLTDTRIVDATGLSKGNVSTVENLARYYTHLRKNYPHIIDITQLTTYVGKNTGYINNNPGRSFSNFTGGKHGYTEEAGRTFVGTFRQEETGSEIGIVLLKSTDLSSDIQAIQSSRKR